MAFGEDVDIEDDFFAVMFEMVTKTQPSDI
jgi:hypothetical protein